MQAMLGSRTKRLFGALAFFSTLFVVVACSTPPEEPETTDVVQVSGEFGASPKLTYSAPLKIAQSESELIWAGDGPSVEEGDTVLLNIYAQNAEDGSQVRNTFFDMPQIFEVTPESLGEVLYDAVIGQQAGARILVLDEGGTDFPIVLVLDVIAGQSTGEIREVEPDLPEVALADNGEPQVTVSKPLRKNRPDEFQVHALIRGAGSQVQSGQSVIVQYKAVSWSDGKIIDSTWDEGRIPFTTMVGDSLPIPAWDEALIEQSVGSQVMLIAPADLAYKGSDQPWADDTIVFVIDILYAATIEAPDASETAEGDADEGMGDLDLDNSIDE